MVPLSVTLSDLWHGFHGHDIFWSRISWNRRVLLHKQEETIPNTWNGTMFGDLDWPLNASRGFVSISWASCLRCGHTGQLLEAVHLWIQRITRSVVLRLTYVWSAARWINGCITVHAGIKLNLRLTSWACQTTTSPCTGHRWIFTSLTLSTTRLRSQCSAISPMDTNSRWDAFHKGSFRNA